MRLGNIADGDDFFDRKRDQEDFWRSLRSNHLILSGPRRLGKSSLANTFPETSISAYMGRLVKNPIQSLHRLKKIDFKAAGTGVGLELADATTTPWLNQANQLQACLSNAPIFIMIDEFPVFLQQLIAHDLSQARTLVAWLRKWRHTPGMPGRFVFSGSIGLNALLERHGLSTYFNDCQQFELGPFKRQSAEAMLQYFANDEGWQLGDGSASHLCTRVGWLSPFYVNLMLNQSYLAARDRWDEESPELKQIEIIDVDDGYERLLTSRSRFHHWEDRLKDNLIEPELGFCKALLTLLAKSEDGLSQGQLSARLMAQESDPTQRAERIQAHLSRLSEEGYLTPPDKHSRIRFLSFLLRDWWARNHV